MNDVKISQQYLKKNGFEVDCLNAVDFDGQDFSHRELVNVVSEYNFYLQKAKKQTFLEKIDCVFGVVIFLVKPIRYLLT